MLWSFIDQGRDLRVGRLQALTPARRCLPHDDMLLRDACSYYKTFKEQNKPTMCLWLVVFLSEVNHLGLEDGSIFLWSPKRPKEMRDESGLPAAFWVLSSLSWVLMLFFPPPNKAIKTMTYDCVAQWDLQGVQVGAGAEALNLDQWQRKWSELFCQWAFCCCPPGFPCCPCSCPHLPTSQLPHPQGLQVDLSSRGRAIDGEWVAVSKSWTFPVSCPAAVPSLPCVPSDTTPLFSISSAQSSLEGSSTPSIPTFPHATASPHPGFHASLVTAPWWQSSSHSSGVKSNVQSRDTPSCRKLCKLSITPSFKSPPLAFVANLFLF